MTQPKLPVNAGHSRGFILVTSLVFLVVITLLAVSAINSTTIQERMASNQREKSRTRQAADAGLRQAESVLRLPAFNTLPEPQSIVALSSKAEGPASVKIWGKNRMFADADTARTDPAAFLKPQIWTGGNANSYKLDGRLDSAAYYIEYERCIGRDLNPDRAASCDGTAYFRITSRATGENPAAVAVTQSLYKKNY